MGNPDCFPMSGIIPQLFDKSGILYGATESGRWQFREAQKEGTQMSHNKALQLTKTPCTGA